MNTKKALELISPIPADEFIVGDFSDEKSKCCVIGHLQRLTSKDPSDYSIRNCTDIRNTNSIRKLSTGFITKKYAIFRNIVDINNRDDINGYNQPEIKDRVVACLKDMIEAGY